jgi:hypothetical protein
LSAYFSSSEICYVPTYAPIAMRVAVEELAQGDERRWGMVMSAQKRLLSASLTTKGFAERHRQLSEELLLHQTGISLRMPHAVSLERP